MRSDVQVSYLECSHSLISTSRRNSPNYFRILVQGPHLSSSCCCLWCTLCHLLLVWWFISDFAVRTTLHNTDIFGWHVYSRGTAVQTQVVVSAVSQNCWDCCQLIVCRDGDVRDAARITYSLIETLSGFIMVGVYKCCSDVIVSHRSRTPILCSCCKKTVQISFFFSHESVKEQWDILHEIRKRKANWIGHILRRNCLLQQVIEGKIKGGIEVTGRRGRRLRKLLDDLKVRRGFSHLEEEALDRTIWRARFGRGFGPVVRQTAKLMNPSSSVSEVCERYAIHTQKR